MWSVKNKPWTELTFFNPVLLNKKFRLKDIICCCKLNADLTLYFIYK